MVSREDRKVCSSNVDPGLMNHSFQGFFKIPIITPIKGMGFIHQGSGLVAIPGDEDAKIVSVNYCKPWDLRYPG